MCFDFWEPKYEQGLVEENRLALFDFEKSDIFIRSKRNKVHVL